MAELPGQPDRGNLDRETLARRVADARDRGLWWRRTSAESGWDAEPVSVLHPDISGGRLDGILAVHSLSKRSNLAGYRAGFVSGDAEVAELLEVRKHAGMLVPKPVQAMIALLGDQEHVVVQRERYLRRRALLRPALEAAGFRIEHSEGSIYLWATRRGQPGRGRGAGRPGHPGRAGRVLRSAAARHIRVALTAPDERVESAAQRLVEHRRSAR